MRRAASLGLVVAAVAAVVLVTRSSSGERHELTMTVPRATGLISGFDVRLGGVPAGKVKSVELQDDYRVRVVLGLDDSAWPLPRDSRFLLRQGGTIHYSDRYVQVERGTSKHDLRDGAAVPASRFVDPVEFDDVLGTFDGPTRAGLRHLFSRGALAAPPVRRHLPRALENGAPAAVAAADVVEQLGGDTKALDTLVRSTAGVAASVANSDPGLGALIDDAATTFTAVAQRSAALRGVLEQAPGTLRAARETAGRVDTALVAARRVTDRLAPAVPAIERLAPPLSSLLAGLTRVGPDASATLSTLRGAAPRLTRLTKRAASPLMPSVERIAEQAEPQVGCVRPYSPEIGGLATNWATLWGAAGDAKDAYFRAQVGAVPYSNETTSPSGQLAALLPKGALRMAFPRPPGQLVDKPWFQPQCGITEDALDITKDPEAQAFDPLSKKIVEPGG